MSTSQRARFDEALRLWSSSDVRAELLGWPRVLAEVPFFSLGLDDDEIRQRFGEMCIRDRTRRVRVLNSTLWPTL